MVTPLPDPDRELFDAGVALFNAHLFFEAHEAWEAVWTGARDPERRWLQGLIQVAAAFVHYERGFHDTGFVKLVGAGIAKLKGHAGNRFDLADEQLLLDLRPWLDHAVAVAAGRGLRERAPPSVPRLACRAARPDP